MSLRRERRRCRVRSIWEFFLLAGFSLRGLNGFFFFGVSCFCFVFEIERRLGEGFLYIVF